MISSLLKKLMHACALDQRGLAEVMGVSVDRVKSLTSGRVKKLTREECEALISKRDVRAAWLVTGEGPMFQTGELQSSFVGRMQVINQERALLDAMPLSDASRVRTAALLTGNPAQDGILIAEAMRYELAGASTILSARESALVENYRAAPEEAKQVLEKTSTYLAQSPGALKKPG